MGKRKGLRFAIRLAVALLAIMLLLFVAVWVFRAGSTLLQADLSASEPDPMFAEPAVAVTRPPELDAEASPKPHRTLDDYVPDVQSPVDKTAEELIEEAKAVRD